MKKWFLRYFMGAKRFALEIEFILSNFDEVCLENLQVVQG